MNYSYYPTFGGDQSQSTSYYQISSDDYDLKIRQQPRDALLAQDGKEKNRKPIDPPPVVEVTVREAADPIKQYLQSPYLFMSCNLVPADTQFLDYNAIDEKGLCGSVISSLHRLKDMDNKDGGFFVFGDVSVKKLGEHKLLFNLFEIQKDGSGTNVLHRSILSDVFTVHPQKEYPGLEESTPLSRTFADQGVRLRLRKESRAGGSGASKKRNNPFNQTSASAAPRSAGPTASTPTTSFGSGVISQTQFSPQTGDPAAKRQRSDESQYAAYPISRSLTDQGTNFGTGLSDPYSSPTTGRIPGRTAGGYPQSAGPNNPTKYSNFYAQASSSTPLPSSEFTYRMPLVTRLDPSLAASSPVGSIGHGSLAPISAGTSGITSAASAFPSQSFSYAGLSGQGSYAPYHQGAAGGPYRSDAGYLQSPSIYQQDQSLSQYGDPNQGYPTAAYESGNNSGGSGPGSANNSRANTNFGGPSSRSAWQ